MIQFTDLPHNIHAQVVENLDLQDRLAFSRTSRQFCDIIIRIIYSRIIYSRYPRRQQKNGPPHLNLPNERYTVIHDSNIVDFFNSLGSTSVLGLKYSDIVQEIYLDGFNKESNKIFDLISWRNNNKLYFPNLRVFQMPTYIEIEPFNHLEVPHQTSLYLDLNFCKRVQKNGMMDFINFAKIDSLHFAAQLSNNEDMVIFHLLTKNPALLKNLKALYFHDSYDFPSEKVYRRLVGFFAILRKMGFILGNLTELSIPMTNQTSSPILHLISRHIIFENLDKLELSIFDDSCYNGNPLQLTETLHTLSTIIKAKGRNITDLSLKYVLEKEDEGKNNLRSMMLLRLAESFNGLMKLCLNIKIDGLNFSNLFMILASTLAKNQRTLTDIKLNFRNPSENLVGNLLPNLEELENLFPEIVFLSNCDCSKCDQINALYRNQGEAVTESIKVSTLMAIGNELNYVQGIFEEDEQKLRYFTPFDTTQFSIRPDMHDRGFLFDHLLKKQINSSLKVFQNLQTIDFCGFTYTKDSDRQFNLAFGNEFKAFDEDVLNAIIEIAQMFGGYVTRDTDMADAPPL